MNFSLSLYAKSPGRGADGSFDPARDPYELSRLRSQRARRLGENVAGNGGALRLTDLLEHSSTERPYNAHGVGDGDVIPEAQTADYRRR